MNRRFLIASLASTLVFLASGLATAQVDVQKDLSDEQLWTDSIYYLKIGRMEYGQAYLKAYLDRKVDPVKTLQYSEKDSRGVQILTRLETDAKIGDLARAALDQIDQGWQIRRQDVPRIGVEIERLGGTDRARFQATQRLTETGEYAVPVMLEYLANKDFKSLQAQIVDAFVAMGPSVVEPLLAALPNLDQNSQMLVVNALGRLDYAQSLPYLKAIVEDAKTTPTVKAVAAQAIDNILSRNPRYRSDVDAAEAYYQLALRYYYQDSAVKPGGQNRVAGLVGDVAATNPNIWLWKDGKLVPQAVPWELYYDLMTMRLSRKSLDLGSQADQRDALTLWLMANCRRASKLSESVKDPLHAADFPTVDYFYRTAGTQYGLESLGRSIVDGDVVVAVASLKALREVASGNNILATACTAQPIVQALASPNQIVRMNAALAIGWAAPTDVFAGMNDVVPLLARIITGVKNPSALLVIPDQAKRTAAVKLAKEMNLEPIEAKDYDAAIEALDQFASDIELIVIDYGIKTPAVGQAIKQIRQNPLLKLVPVIVTVGSDQLADARTSLADLNGLAILPDGSDEKAYADQLVRLDKELGRVLPDKAEQPANALLAAEALEKLARTGLKQYDVEKARGALAEALNHSTDWALAFESAKVLSALCSKEAQQLLADAALTRKDAAQQVALLNVLGESVRLFGNKLTGKQVETLQKMVITETDPTLRQATAKVVGTLNLQPKVARNIILAREPFGATK
jgi:CheY-like chemotaxis protein